MTFNTIENGSFDTYFGKDTPLLVLLKMTITQQNTIINMKAGLSNFKAVNSKGL